MKQGPDIIGMLLGIYFSCCRKTILAKHLIYLQDENRFSKWNNENEWLQCKLLYQRGRFVDKIGFDIPIIFSHHLNYMYYFLCTV